MNYQEQLESNEWQIKRKSILARDRQQCQQCFNESFKIHFRYGLINSNKVEKFGTKPWPHNDAYCINVWNFKEDKLDTMFISNTEYSPDESYVVYYTFTEGYKHPQLIALKNIDQKKIVFKKKMRNGGKVLLSLIDPESYKEIERNELPTDSWAYVSGLHVHHTYYQSGLLAWQYPDEALITLCWECHKKLHENTLIPVLNAGPEEDDFMTPCQRCYGAGFFPEFVHIQSGICFRCHGARFEELIC